VSINADFAREDLDKVLATANLPWPQHFNRTGEPDAAVQKFGIAHFPSLWLVDRQGVARYISAGQDLDIKVSRLVAEAAGPTNATEDGSPGWKERLIGVFSGSKDDPAAARQALLEDPKSHLDIKNVVITAKRRVATVKTSGATQQLVVGKVVAVATPAGSVSLVCRAIEKDGLIFQIVGRADTFKIDF
jgi:hypothetical protein